MQSLGQLSGPVLADLIQLPLQSRWPSVQAGSRGPREVVLGFASHATEALRPSAEGPDSLRGQQLPSNKHAVRSGSGGPGRLPAGLAAAPALGVIRPVTFSPCESWSWMPSSGNGAATVPPPRTMHARAGWREGLIDATLERSTPRASCQALDSIRRPEIWRKGPIARLTQLLLRSRARKSAINAA